jgi:hypothetical protein
LDAAFLASAVSLTAFFFASLAAFAAALAAASASLTAGGFEHPFPTVHAHGSTHLGLAPPEHLVIYCNKYKIII